MRWQSISIGVQPGAAKAGIATQVPNALLVIPSAMEESLTFGSEMARDVSTSARHDKVVLVLCWPVEAPAELYSDLCLS